MQPLAYLGVRALLGWLQLIERSSHAFLSNPLLLVAAGAAHSWAVVYALFVAVHTRAMRYEGYHEGYTEHLPSWLSGTEMLTVLSMWIWLLAGFTTAAVRILDEEANDLPMGMEDTKVGPITKFIRSPVMQATLSIAHSVSCVGLFVSILLLGIAMAAMSGGITTCELCLVFVAFGFAAPHAVIAGKRFNLALGEPLDTCIEAAAAEASALGPQLCVLLALADAPGHAYIWQKTLYMCASLAFVAAVVACGLWPSKTSGTALPPELGESITCLILDVVGAFVIIQSFPHLNTWMVWLAAVACMGVAAAMVLPDCRAWFVDLLDPLFVVRSDTQKRVPNARRQRVKAGAWGACIACAVAALWDVSFHTVVVPQQQEFYNPWADHMLMFRWRPSVENRTSLQMLSTVADALGVKEDTLQIESVFAEHRLMMFKPRNATSKIDDDPVHLHWSAAVMAPKGEMAEIMDNTFPATFNATMCGPMEEAAEKNNVTEGSQDNGTADTRGEARQAYLAACHWWKLHVLGAIGKIGRAQ